MADGLPQQAGRVRAREARALWRGFRRARFWLWSALIALTAGGAILHDALTATAWARVLWLVVIALSIARPLRHLFEFRCPRCTSVYLATGRLRDFLSLHRILWSRRCGTCALPAGEDAGELPDSRPAAL